jgi:hypothetical protein
MYLGDNFIVGAITELVQDFRASRPDAHIMLTAVAQVRGVHEAIAGLVPSARGELEVNRTVLESAEPAVAGVVGRRAWRRGPAGGPGFHRRGVRTETAPRRRTRPTRRPRPAATSAAGYTSMTTAGGSSWYSSTAGPGRPTTSTATPRTRRAPPTDGPSWPPNGPSAPCLVPSPGGSSGDLRCRAAVHGQHDRGRVRVRLGVRRDVKPPADVADDGRSHAAV